MQQITKNDLTAKELQMLRAAAGFTSLPLTQMQAALKGQQYALVVREEGQAIAAARLVGDGCMYWYLQDVIVLPQHQGKGLGKLLVKNMLDYIYAHTPKGNIATIGLFAAEGKEEFYQKLGFSLRPGAGAGAGMQQKYFG